MAKVTYEILEQEIFSFPDVENYSNKDLNLIENFPVNKSFDYSQHYIETHFYSVNNVRLFSSYDYTLPVPGNNTDSDSTEITLDPSGIANEFGFGRSDVKVLFHFLNDLYNIGNSKTQLYIQGISDDRTEVVLYSDKLPTNRLINRTEELKELLDSKSYFEEMWLNLGDNDLFIITNIGVWELEDKVTIALKLYEPLPDSYEIKDVVQVVEKVSDSKGFLVETEIEEEEVPGPKLRQANFAVDVYEDTSEPTEYFTYDDLFSYSNTNSNRELFNVIKDKSINLGVDYSKFENFINFSSATERLKNFRYKVTLLETYQSDLESEEAVLNQSTTATSASISATRNLIKGLVENFDHYEKHLYFESGSNSWPKYNDAKPYTNHSVTSSDAITWYNAQLASASIYDTSNYDVLTNFLPEYILDDEANANGVMFTHMLGQHFDNLWIYTKALTEKYNADNRLNFGLSKDIVQEAVKSFGVKIHNSTEGRNDLFKYFINDTYDSGSINEVINVFRPPYSNSTQASASLKFSGGNPADNVNNTVTFESTDGHTVTYQGKANAVNGSIDPASNNTLFNTVGSSAAVRLNLLAAITGSTGHKDKIEFHSTSGTDTLVVKQTIPGIAGNTSITFGSSVVSAVLAVGTDSAFTGGNSVQYNSLSSKDYEAQVYKRIYHNIPLLLKSKGTERGLRALINCFGIPSNILSIRRYGGFKNTKWNVSDQSTWRYFGPDQEVKLATDKVDIAPSGSGTHDDFILIDGKSIRKDLYSKSQDSHRLEVGFSPSNAINDRLSYSDGDLSATGAVAAYFNLDNYIGDPRDLTEEKYLQKYDDTNINANLQELAENKLSSFEKYDLKDFVRSFKFYDNVLFKMVKDFIPTRASSDVGIILKPHYLERNKIKSPALTGTDETLSGSIDTAFITGSHGGAYPDKIKPEYKLIKGLQSNFSPGRVGGASDLVFRINFANYTNPPAGDNGEITPEGDIILHPNGNTYDIREYRHVYGSKLRKLIGTPFESSNPSNNLYQFYIMFSEESIDTRFSGQLTSHNIWHHSNLIAVRFDENNGTNGNWLAQGNSLNDTASFTPLPSDLILASFQQYQTTGISEEIHTFYTPINGLVVNNPSTASAVIHMHNDTPTQNMAEFVTITTTVGDTLKLSSTGTPGNQNNVPSSGTVIFYTGSSPLERANNMAAVITGSNGLQYKMKAEVITTNNTSSLHLFQIAGGHEGNRQLSINDLAITNKFFYPSDEFFSGGHNGRKKNVQHNTSTVHSLTYSHLTGSTVKHVLDESPKFTGELEGTTLLISDGELNRDNTFKEFDHPLTPYNITAVSQSVADILTEAYFTDTDSTPGTVDVYNSANNACSAFSTIADTVIMYWGGNQSNPVDGDTFYTDINGNNTFTGNGNYYSWAVVINNIPTTYVGQINSSGVLSNMQACSELDSTAPSGYTAAWTNSNISSNNYTSVPYTLEMGETGATAMVTASDESGNEVKTSFTYPSGTAFSGLINTSTLDDGEDITLDIKMQDVAGNVGASAAASSTNGTFGLTIPKQVAASNPTAVRFEIAETSTMIQQNTNITAKYKLTMHFPTTFLGTANFVLSGSWTGGGGTLTGTKNINTQHQALSPGTASFVFDDSFAGTVSNKGTNTSFDQTGLGNTVYGEGYLTDTNGNVGSTLNDSVSYQPHALVIHTSDQGTTHLANFSVSQANQVASTRFRARWANAIYDVVEETNRSWYYLNTSDYGTLDRGLGSTLVSHYFTYNSSGQDRYVTVKAQKIVDGYTYQFPIGSAVIIEQKDSATCVHPETQILMREGITKNAKDIKVGDVVRTYHELSQEFLEDIVIRTVKHTGKDRVEVIFEDNTSLICTPLHRLYDKDADAFVAVKNLKVGTNLKTNTIKEINEYEQGDVYEFTTEKTHTYITNGVLSHNIK